MSEQSWKATAYAACLNAIERARRQLRIPRKPRVLVDCLQPFHYHHIKPVVDRLIADGLMEPLVLASPSFGPNERTERLVSPARFIDYRWARFRQFDVTISTDVWRTRVPLRGLEIYAPHGAGMKSNYATGERIAPFDLIFVVGQRREIVQAAHVVSPEKLVRTGFIVTETPPPSAGRKAALLAGLGLSPGRPLVLYTPSWSINPELIAMSESLLSEFANQTTWNILVRPHPHLLEPERCGGTEWRRILNGYASPRFAVADDQFEPAQTYMHLSDALVADFGSTAFEYLFLDKPIVIQRSEHALSYYDGEDAYAEILPAAQTFSDPQSAVTTIARAFEESTRQSIERRRIVNERYFNVGRAAAAAVDAIYERLALTPQRS